jgi:hypothetical protein
MKSLADCEAGPSVRVARILDQEPAFLQFVNRCGLTPGVKVEVQNRDDIAEAITIRAAGKSGTTLGKAAAKKILVERA